MCASFVRMFVHVPAVTTIASSTHTPVMREMNQDGTVVTIVIIVIASGITAIIAITIVIIIIVMHKRQSKRQGLRFLLEQVVKI